MKYTRTGLIVGAGLATALVIAGCGSNGAPPSGSGSGATGNTVSSSCGTGSLRGAGSTFQDPMEQNWISGYAGQCSRARVSYNAVGSGTGIQNFGNSQVDFAGSDVTMKPDEQSKADSRCGGSTAIHIPVTAGGVGVTYNLSGVDSLQLSGPTLAKIFGGKVKNWNDAPIMADNPGATLPNTSIKVFTRSDPSGTTAVFTSFLKAAGGSDWTLGSAKDTQFPVGTGKPKSNGVATAVKGANGGITYVEEAYATQNQLKLAKVKNAGGSYVELTPANVSSALESAKITGTAPDLTERIDYTPTAATAYPISTVSYAIVCSKYPSGFTGVNLLKGFLTYAVTTGQAPATGLGFAPLPSATATAAKASIATIS